MQPRRRSAEYESTASIIQRTKWLRIGVWIFIIIFAFSVVGGLFAFSGFSSAH